MQKMTDSTIIEPSDNSMEAETNVEDIKSSLKVLIDDLDSINNALERERQNIIGVEKSLTYIMENNPKQAIQEVPASSGTDNRGSICFNIGFSIFILLLVFILFWRYEKKEVKSKKGSEEQIRNEEQKEIKENKVGYSNLDSSSLFILFKKYFNEDEKNYGAENNNEENSKVEKRDESSIKQRFYSILEWLVSDFIVFSTLILIIIYIFYVVYCVIVKNYSLAMLAPGFSFFALLFLAVYLNKISCHFKEEEKIKAVKAINKIATVKNIEWTEKSIDIILHDSVNIGEQPFSDIRSISKRSEIRFLFIILGSVITYILEGFQNVFSKVIFSGLGDGNLQTIIFSLLLLILMLYDILFSLYVIIERKALLFRKVLEEKRLTLALKK